ncbi:VOC family protein [Humidisolicoccus flavus]|uniref:VOC family protein n=1 Tax=Humidisolicoccus flavus TaxID=3111414 RepID=UPI003249DD6E
MATIDSGFGGFAAPDLDAIEHFYGNVLSVQVRRDAQMGLVTLLLGDGEVMIYFKPDHAPANFTVLSLVVSDLDETVRDLATKGVEFERYEGFEHDELGIVRDPRGPAIAWTRDPAGNIVSILEGDEEFE